MREGDRGLAVQGAGLVVLLRSLFDAGHVAEPHDARHRRRRARAGGRPCAAWPDAEAAAARQAAQVGLEDDVGELLRVGEPAQRIDGQLELLALGDRLLADLSGGNLDVLLADGRDHVHGAEAEGRHLVGVEPDAEAVVALAEVRDAGDAGEPAQFVLDVHRGIVAQPEVVVLAVGRDQVHDHQRVGRHLPDVDALVLHQGGNDREGQRHAVLHQHLGHVRVHAQLEGHGQVVGAVVGRARRHVGHALDAADLLLDRGRHGVLHGQGVGARIEGRHEHRRRRDLRVLGHGQREHGHPARQHEHHGDDRGKDRTIDKEADHACGPNEDNSSHG